MCYKKYIGNINGYPLDDQQIMAATSKDKYSIIVAGAGSGKSTTMIGKIKYLVNYLNIAPSEILCISFTNESTNSLQKNIIKNCNFEVEVKTFHKLALSILEDNSIKYNLCPLNYLEYIINEFLLIDKNKLALNTVIPFLKSKYYNRNIEKYKSIIKTKEFDSFKKLLAKFLKIYFTKYDSIDNLKILFINSKKYKDKAFLKLVIAIYRLYEIEKKSQNFIDFDDMIKLATNIIIQNGYIRNYKYIIIDEFQDTSSIRFNLIKAIIKRNHSNLTVVGDDFQSIYRFSGCDLDIFLNFQNDFNKVNILKLENTYRNSQELIDIAGNFIMKNPRQIKKNLKSIKRFKQPIKVIYEKKNALKKLLIILNKTNYKNILILGRNNFDIFKYVDNDFKVDKEGFINIYGFNKNIRYLTVHKSKGLEADCVIILNLINTQLGFPNKIEDNKIIDLVSLMDSYPFEEERRLFYVALTRTKNEVYLLTQKNNSSIFVKELIKEYKNDIDIIKNDF